MPLYLTDDQAMLRDTARSFMAEEGAISKQLRHWRDKGCKDGFGHGLWKQFAEMGFTGILIDEADGGLGLGHVEAGIVLEEIGRNLTPSPFLTSAVAFVEALKGTAHAGRWFPGILAGETVAALAIDEGPKHRPEAIEMRAERSGNGFKLSGRKQFVVQGASADITLVAAQTDEGTTLFAVEKDSKGLEVEGVRLADASIGARLTFDDVEVDADAVVGEVGGGEVVLSRVVAYDWLVSLVFMPLGYVAAAPLAEIEIPTVSLEGSAQNTSPAVPSSVSAPFSCTRPSRSTPASHDWRTASRL